MQMMRRVEKIYLQDIFWSSDTKNVFAVWNLFPHLHIERVRKHSLKSCDIFDGIIIIKRRRRKWQHQHMKEYLETHQRCCYVLQYSRVVSPCQIEVHCTMPSCLVSKRLSVFRSVFLHIQQIISKLSVLFCVLFFAGFSLVFMALFLVH